LISSICFYNFHQAHLPNGPEGAISHDVSTVMLETLKQNVEGLEALFKVREKRLKFKVDQFHAMNRNPDVAHIMCMKVCTPPFHFLIFFI
jgi:hypothetical protein